MVRDPMNTPVHAVRHMGCHRHTQGASSPTAGGVRDPEEIGPCRSLRWREVHQFPFPRTSSPAATVDHSKTMRVLMLQEELVQLDPERCRLLKRDSQMQYPPTGPQTTVRRTRHLPVTRLQDRGARRRGTSEGRSGGVVPPLHHLRGDVVGGGGCDRSSYKRSLFSRISLTLG